MARPIRDLTAAWEAAEARLYPVVLRRPDDYVRYLRLVRAIADELDACETVEALAESFERATEITAAAVARSGALTENLDLDLAAGAAFALAYRHVQAASARSDAVARIEAARARGDAWVTVSEWGDPSRGPYERLELHVVDGGSVRASILLDAESGDPRYVAEAFRLDPRTGGRPARSSTIARPTESRDRAEWEHAVAELRAVIERGSG